MFSFFTRKKEEIIQKKVTEPQSTDYEDISCIAEYFKNETGVTFDKQTTILKSKVITFCKQRDILSFKSLLKTIDSDKNLKQELIDYLTTNETFFYREIKQIEELVALVKGTHKSVKILCAPSATGEEPYSIAIALLESGVPSSRFTIVGIDINAQAIDKAKIASYKERSVRNLPHEVITKYFTQENSLYTLKTSITSLVTFKVANIFESSFSNIGKFDYIFSRNMLIYFDDETKQRAKRILESLRSDPTQKVFFGHADLFYP